MIIGKYGGNSSFLGYLGSHPDLVVFPVGLVWTAEGLSLPLLHARYHLALCHLLGVEVVHLLLHLQLHL